MRFGLPSFKKPIKKLSPLNGFKKPIMGDIKLGSKLLAAGTLMGGGTELASRRINKGQTMGDRSEYVLMEDFGPCLVTWTQLSHLQVGGVGIQASDHL